MGLTLSGPLREVVGLGSYNSVTMDRSGPNKMIDIGEWSLYGDGQIDRFLLDI